MATIAEESLRVIMVAGASIGSAIWKQVLANFNFNKMSKMKIVLALAFALSISPFANAAQSVATASKSGSASVNASGVSFETWLVSQERVSRAKLLANISPEGAAKGAVVASPSRTSPPYFFHWVRDAALTMQTVLDMFENSTGAERAQYKQMLVDYARFSRQNQLTETRGGIGEPKYNADGSAYNGDWGRPQNDGPALRAAVLTRFAWLLLKEGDVEFVRNELYSPRIPAETVIKTDLEYVSHHWTDRSFDLWEEVEGHHFYTHMVQRRSLVEGAELADYLGDGAAAAWYREQASNLETDLENYWNADQAVFIPTLKRTGGLSYKTSNLDAAVIMSILHGYSAQPFLRASDARAISTFAKQVESFKGKYAINNRADIPGVAIGRYPEDLFAGNDFNGGNPWPLLTAGFAQYCYRAAIEMVDAGNVQEARAYLEQGDLFLRRVQYHTGPDGALSEQMNRDTGHMMAARDLTWSYGEVIEAIWKRKLALDAVTRLSQLSVSK